VPIRRKWGKTPIMMFRMTTMLSAFALLGACAAERPELEPPVRAGDTIRFSAGPCFGVCPSYALTVTPDGSGLLEPQRFTAVPGPTRFTVTPTQYARLRRALLSFKPAAGTVKRIAQGENCARFATDMPVYVLEWTRGQGKPTRLEYQSGCMDPGYAKLRATIGGIPKMLGVEAMVRPAAKG
jgi:hypothetical protein